jgi:hypothetical protein
MTSSQFIELVREMRYAQQQYFKDRTQSALTRAKDLERKVDKHLAAQQTNFKQTSLL